MTLPNIVALDAGGATLKASVVVPYGSTTAPTDNNLKQHTPFVLANHVATLTSSSSSSSAAATTLIGQELLDKERQGAKLRYVRPVERGYCVNWNVETDVWSHLFSPKALDIVPSDHALVATAPLFAPTILNDTMDEVAFETFGFEAFARVSAAEMSALSFDAQRRHSNRNSDTSDTATTTTAAASSCYVVVDAGFSFTHVVPILNGRVLLAGVKRINIGGKLLTNYLKEIVSFRQYDVQDDTRVLNDVKESLCYVARDFASEMRSLYAAPRSKQTHYVLPDYVNTFSGYKLQHQHQHALDAQTLVLSTELIAVPEVLFHPSDIGLEQAGVAETIVHAVTACPRDLHASLFANVLLVGGCTQFPLFRMRLEAELRALVPSEFEVQLHVPNDPITAAWDGCTRFAASAACAARVVTKREYDERGSNVCRLRF